MSMWFSFGGATYFSVFVVGSSVNSIASSSVVFCFLAFSTCINASWSPFFSSSLSHNVGNGNSGILLFFVPISVVRRLMSYVLSILAFTNFETDLANSRIFLLTDSRSSAGISKRGSGK